MAAVIERGPFNLLDLFFAMSEWEREDLGQTSDDDGPPATPACCSFTTINLRKMRDLDNDIGDGLYRLLEDAETISKERSAEGYYLATCQHIKTLHAVRVESLATADAIVAHHNRTHMSCRTNVIRRTNVSLERRLRNMEERNHELERSNDVLRQQVTTTQTISEQHMQNRIECLKMQFESRYEARLENQARIHTELMDTLKRTIVADTVEINTLRKELIDARHKNKSSKSVIAFLNKRVRDVVRCIRKNKTDGGPKCAILGTYDDVLGAPV